MLGLRQSPCSVLEALADGAASISPDEATNIALICRSRQEAPIKRYTAMTDTKTPGRKAYVVNETNGFHRVKPGESAVFYSEGSTGA